MITNKYSQIIYLQSDNIKPTNELIDKLENDVICKINLCNSWPSLISKLSILSDNIPVLLVDIKMFRDSNSTVNEIVNMISTLYRCLDTNIKLTLGVVVEKECTSQIIKSLKQSDIIGVIPCPIIYGYDKTLTALSQIISGKRYWPKDIIDLITGKVIIQNKENDIVLTDRQIEILTLVCNRGLSNKKIAQALKISESTVKIHFSAIMKKYCVRNRTQLVLAAKSSLSV